MQLTNATPYTYIEGIDDESQETAAIVAQETPTHLPLIPDYFPWGPDDDIVIVDSGALSTIYGADALNTRSPSYTLASFYASRALANGNQIAVKRLLPDDVGPKARILLSLDIVADSIQQYKRDSQGKFLLDANGNKQPVTGAGATVAGYKAKWVLNSWLAGTDNAEAYGEVATRVGSLTATTGGAQSTLYPFLEFEATFHGSLGNNLGMRLIAPTTASTITLNKAQAQRIGAYIFQMQMLSRSSALSSPSVTASQSGEQWVQFALKPSAYDATLDQDLDFQDVLATAYSQHGIVGNPPIYGPFENAQIYTDNVQEILDMIGAAEAPQGYLSEATYDADSMRYEINPLTATNYDGVPYTALQVLNAADGGLVFSSSSSVFASGASDGTTTAASFDADCQTFYNSIPGSKFENMSRYPFTILYDYGHTLATKYAMMPLWASRPNITMIFTTQDITQAQNTPDQDESMASAIAAAAGNYPESTVYGTSALRGQIVEGSGLLLPSYVYKGIVPLTIQMMNSFSEYMGAANGIWKGDAPDENPGNVMTMFRKTNVSIKTPLARSSDWSLGMTWFEPYDTNSWYCPALASLYTKDTSILKGFMNVLIAADLILVAHTVRRDLSGNSRLTDAQFIQRSNQLIQQRTNGRYDGRVTIVPDTYYSTADKKRKYSWHTNITMYGDDMRTADQVTVTARQRSDLPVASSS